jgi:DNA-binding MarR family transcriptional regulator
MKASSDLVECQDCLCTASRSAARGITSVFDRHLRPHGLRTTQFTILTNLMLRGPTPIGVLAKALGLERTTMTRNVAVLAARGWTQEKIAADDSRSHIISVTAAGEGVVREAFGAWREAQRRAASILGEAGVAAVRRMSRSKFRA